ncbi:DUF1634 domain-containing protein [Granulicella sp. L46]|jgi:uncharacterized membrane protein|uniref:DUF1634 domain-containing protein n=1 Tax=Granulicella sp. L46 TaxID=1641865 RepID=UPI00131E1AB1|nr:DUF1634 domain-containing protein [Granulicella sp. L46]
MSKPTDQDVDISVAAMLRIGITLAATVVFAGGVLYLRHPWATTPNYSHFQGAGRSLSTVSGIGGGLIHFHPQSVIQFGLLLLIATPVARVVLCIIGFARQKDRLYVLVSSVVLLVLIYSLSKGAR